MFSPHFSSLSLDNAASPSVRRFIGMRPPHYASFSSGSRDFLSYRSHIADFEASSFRSGGSNGGSASVLSRPPRKACVSLAIGLLVKVMQISYGARSALGFMFVLIGWYSAGKCGLCC